MCGCCGCGPTTPPAIDRSLQAVDDTSNQQSIPTLGAAGAGGSAANNVMGGQTTTDVALDNFKGATHQNSFLPPRVLTGLRRITIPADNASGAAADNPEASSAIAHTGSPSNSGAAVVHAGSTPSSVTAAKVVQYRPGILTTDREIDAKAQPHNSRKHGRRLTAPPQPVAGKAADVRALKTDRPPYRALTLQVPPPKGPSPHSVSTHSSDSGGGFTFSINSSGTSTANSTPKETTLQLVTTGAHSANNSMGDISGLRISSQIDHSAAAAAGAQKTDKPKKKSVAADLDQLVVDADFYPDGQVEVAANALAAAANHHHQTFLANEEGGAPIVAEDESPDLIYSVGSPKHANRPSPTSRPAAGGIELISDMSLMAPKPMPTAAGAAGGAAAIGMAPLKPLKSAPSIPSAGAASGAATNPTQLSG
jgi:hypothetical protein